MEGSAGNGGMETLERELQCAVSKTTIQKPETRALMGPTTDMHRYPVPTADATELSTHILRVLLEGMVLMASDLRLFESPINQPIHLPIMPRSSERDAGRLQALVATGGISKGEPG